MTEIRIAAIVEGHGEVQAVPVLLRRVARNENPQLVIKLESILRVSAASLLRKQGELERNVELAARKLGGEGAIFILLDCDWDSACPKSDGPELLKRAQAVRPDMTITVVLAYQEYETWFIAAAESLRGRRGLPNDLTAPPNPESIRGAKEWLSERKPLSSPYAEVTDQPALTELFDFSAARSTDSFDKCYREIVQLFKKLTKEK